MREKKKIKIFTIWRDSNSRPPKHEVSALPLCYNATVKLFFQCMDFGFHQSLYRAMMMHSSGLDQVRRSLQVDIDSVGKALSGLDSRLDKQRFFEYNNAAFMIPKKFEYNPVRRDEVRMDFFKLYFYFKK